MAIKKYSQKANSRFMFNFLVIWKYIALSSQRIIFKHACKQLCNQNAFEGIKVHKHKNNLRNYSS